MTKVNQKIYPQATIEAAKMLGIYSEEKSADTEVHALDGHLASAADLKGSHEEKAVVSSHGGKKDNNSNHKDSHNGHSEHSSHEEMGSESGESGHASVGKKLFVSFFPYILVFIVGLVLYYFFFTTLDFSNIFKFKTQTVVQTTKEDILAGLKKQNEVAYKQWISSFYFDVTDPKITDMDTDNSGNGLTNFQKYVLGLNPKAYDSLGLGMADSESLSAGINPVTGSPLTDEQKTVVEKNIDMEGVMNRFALNNFNKQTPSSVVSPQTSQVLGAKIISPRVWQGGASQTAGQQINQFTPILGVEKTNPNTIKTNPIVKGATVKQAPSSGPTAPALDNPYGIEIDQSIPARLEIPALKINVPIMWTQKTSDFLKDLKSGVVHYPGTAMPGETGTAYVSGHSSNYAWVKGDYNKVFSTLGDLPDNASFKITVVQKNGKDAILHYVVVRRKVYGPKDQEQFENTNKSLVALSTCWPIGTTKERLVVFGELSQVVKQ